MKSLPFAIFIPTISIDGVICAIFMIWLYFIFSPPWYITNSRSTCVDTPHYTKRDYVVSNFKFAKLQECYLLQSIMISLRVFYHYSSLTPIFQSDYRILPLEYYKHCRKLDSLFADDLAIL